MHQTLTTPKQRPFRVIPKDRLDSIEQGHLHTMEHGERDAALDWLLDDIEASPLPLAPQPRWRVAIASIGGGFVGALACGLCVVAVVVALVVVAFRMAWGK